LKGVPSNTNANGSISTVAGSVAPARGCSPSRGEPHGGAGIVLNDVRGLVANRNRALELYPLVQDKLDCIFNQADFEQNLSLPFLERASIYLIFHFRFQLQDRLVDSLKLLSQLPDSFVREVSDRLACGMAIILRVSNHKVLKLHEWELLGNLLGRGTYYEKSWRYALDGIASFTEQFICPSSSEHCHVFNVCAFPLCFRVSLLIKSLSHRQRCLWTCGKELF